MANIEARQLTLTYGTTKNYFSGSGLYIDYQGWSQQPMAIWGSKNGTATMKDAGKTVLYPKAGVHPFKADFNIIGASSVSDPVIQIHFDNTLVFWEQWPNDGDEHPVLYQGMVEPGILNSTIDSSITINLSASATSLFGGFGLRNNSYLKFYFQQWDLTAEKIGDGDGLISTPGRVYDGESVKFSVVTITPGSTWQGWYSDQNHTQLVSTDREYTITANQDIKLYAYITKKSRDTSLYFKETNWLKAWDNPYRVFQKTINGWTQISDMSPLKNNIYRLGPNIPIITRNLSDMLNQTLTIDINYTHYNRPCFCIINDIPNAAFQYTPPIEDHITINDLSLTYKDNCLIYSFGGNSAFITSQYMKSTINVYNSVTMQDLGVVNINVNANQNINANIYFKNQNNEKYNETVDQRYGYQVTVPSNYTNFIGWREFYGNEPTGRILEVGQTYYDVGNNKLIHYEPVFSE